MSEDSAKFKKASPVDKSLHQVDPETQKVPLTFEKHEERRKQATEERRAAQAAKQTLRRKEEAAERIAVARREAARQVVMLQERLIHKYGYSHRSFSSVTEDPEAIEMSPISDPERDRSGVLPEPAEDNDPRSSEIISSDPKAS